MRGATWCNTNSGQPASTFPTTKPDGRVLYTARKVRAQFTSVSKGAKIRNRYNQVPHPTQDTNGKVTNSQLDIKNESQEVSPFPAGDHKAQLNRRAHRHNKHKTEQEQKDPQKKYRLGTVSKILHWSQYIFFTCVALAKAGLVVGPLRPSGRPSVRASVRASVRPSEKL